MSLLEEAQPISEFARDIVEVPVAEELSDSFLAYALSVITSRAIPDVRDGLKPVQRRILYAMLRMGIRPDTPHRKCARVVGETMGKYHPHGDAALYDALVRLGQDFARGVILVDPQGNFGSLDDPPAAARYTECRLSEAAMAMLAEIDEQTVDFRPSYDGEAEEPEFLPSRLPNLLANGSAGIAVGMATNMVPHNVGEITKAMEEVLKAVAGEGGKEGAAKETSAKENAKAGSAKGLVEQSLGVPHKQLLKMGTDELEQVRAKELIAPPAKEPTNAQLEKFLTAMPGPDFPSGGMLINAGMREIYKEGRGSLRLRSKADIIHPTKKREAIVITELPWMVGPERVVAKIKSLIAEEKVPQITGVRNLTDRERGLCIQIDLKPGANGHKVLDKLYSTTPLEASLPINNVVLVRGVPTTASYWDICRHFLYHRLGVVIRRTHFRRRRDLARCEILEGFLLALDRIEEVVAIIRGSANVDEARRELCAQIGLNERQAEAVLELRLRRLTALEQSKITAERDGLLEAIDGHNKLLGSEAELRKAVLRELREVAKEFGQPRRTKLMDSADLPAASADDSEDVEVQECLVTLSANGYVGRAGLDDPAKKNSRPHDVLLSAVETQTDRLVWAITSAGRAVPASVWEVSELKGPSRGTLANKVFALESGEEVLHLFANGGFSGGKHSTGSLATTSLKAGSEGTESEGSKLGSKSGSSQPASSSQPSSLMLISSGGIAKRISSEALEKSLPTSASDSARPAPQDVFQLSAGDSLVAAFPCSDADEIMAITSSGMAFRTNASEIPLKSPKAAGVIGMKLKAKDAVVGAGSFRGGTGGGESQTGASQTGQSQAAEKQAAQSQAGTKQTEKMQASRAASPPEESIVFVICEGASAKAVFTDEFSSQKRGGMGVQLVPSGNQKVLAAFVGEDTLCATKDDTMLFPLEVAKRTHQPKTTDVQITHIGFPRWSM